ncbi:MAG: hypothetical protein U0165_20680 [Polyangiaceae bacterium]
MTTGRGFDALRERAEQILLTPNAEGVQTIVEEMSVLWTELELQADELQRSELAASEARAHYFSLFEEAPTCFLVLDADERLLESNQRARELLQLGDKHGETRFDLFVAPESLAGWIRLWKSRQSRSGSEGDVLASDRRGASACSTKWCLGEGRTPGSPRRTQRCDRGEGRRTRE